MSGLRLRPASSANEWDALTARFAERTPFHGWDFLHGEARAGGWKVAMLIAERDGLPVGVVPIAVERGPLRRTPPFQHPYHGPLVLSEDLPDLLRLLRRERRRRRMARLTVSFPPESPGDRAAALQRAGWSVLLDRTYEVDLRETALMSGEAGEVMPFVPSGHRRRVRRALAKGVVARQVDRVDGLLLETMDRAFRAHDGQNRLDDDALDWVNRVIARGDAVALEAVHEDRRLGVIIRLRGAGREFAWIGAVLPEGRPLAAATVLYHEHLRLAAADGASVFDLVGRVDEGVAAFKRSMGGVEREFVEGSDSAVLLVLARSAARLLRRLRTRPQGASADGVSAPVTSVSGGPPASN